MSVMPAAVFDEPSTGMPASCATGSAANAELESVGPRMATTLSWLISFWKALMACALSPAVSSQTIVQRGIAQQFLVVDLLGGQQDAVVDRLAVDGDRSAEGVGAADDDLA